MYHPPPGKNRCALKASTEPKKFEAIAHAALHLLDIHRDVTTTPSLLDIELLVLIYKEMQLCNF